MRTIALTIAALGAGLTAQDHLPAPLFRAHPVLDTKDLEVTLRVREKADGGTPDWLQLVFENRTEEPIRLAQVGYRIDYEAESIESGDHWRHGSLGRGTRSTLFPTKNGAAPIPPGVTRVVEPLTDSALAALGLSPRAGARVDATLSIGIALHGQLAADSRKRTEVPFRFEWHHPGAAALRRLRAQLDDRLRNPIHARGGDLFVRTALGIRGVGDRVDLDLLLEVAANSDTPINTRRVILSHVNAKHAEDPRVVQWVKDQIHDIMMLRFLNQQLTSVWDPSLLPIVMKRYTWFTRNVVILLERHKIVETGGPELRAKLSKVLVERLPTEIPTRLEDLGADGRARDRLSDIRQAFHLIGRTKDTATLPLLDKWFDCKLSIHPGLPPGGNVLSDPHRICDCALFAALRILGRDVFKMHRELHGNPFAWGPNNGGIDEVRDGWIRDVRTILKKRAKAGK